jgi:hypothetical protein
MKIGEYIAKRFSPYRRLALACIIVAMVATSLSLHHQGRLLPTVVALGWLGFASLILLGTFRVRCPKCKTAFRDFQGMTISKSAKFCPYCGVDLHQEMEQ